MAARSAENVQVVVRCRPLNQSEIAEKLPSIAKVDEQSREVAIEVKGRGLTKTFTYDAAYGPAASQRDIYNGTVLPIVQEVLEGYNCTIFAYGQTGTGKTYTMEGNRDTEDTSQLDSKARLKASREAGIISRAINTIFEHLAKISDEYSVKVSHLELYNEELFDLLDPDNKGLKIFEDPLSTTGSITIRGLTEANVYSPTDIFNILEKSWQERRTAETTLSKESSRSHCIFSITIHMKERNIEGEDLLKVGKLNLVDLAGSENVVKAGMQQKLVGRQETGMINKSLLAFGRVITALVDQAPHVPYRESKLTRLLQDSLGGRTKTCIIATISPASVSLDETIGTLEYAQRAKSIKNQPQVNAKLSKKEFLGEYAKEMDDIRHQLDAMRRKDGVYMPHEQYLHMNDDLRTKNEEIEILLEEKKVKEKEFDEIHEMFDLQCKELKDTQSTLHDTQGTLEATIHDFNDALAALEKTRVDLGEHKLVLTERAQTEATFHQEASVLLSVIGASLKDIEGLGAKVGRQEALHEVNKATWSDLKTDLVAKVQKSEEDVKSFVSAQGAKFRELDAAIGRFATYKDAEVVLLQDRVTELDHLVEASRDNVSELIDGQIGEQQLAQNEMRTVEQEHQAALAKQVVCFADGVESKVNLLINTINSYDQRTKQWSEAKENELKESVGETDLFAESQKAKIANFRDHATKQIATEIASYAENRIKLTSFMELQTSDMREFQTKLLASISVIMADFVAKRELDMSITLKSFGEAYDARVDNLAKLDSSLGSVTDDLTAQISSHVKESSTKKSNIIESIKKMSEITSGISKINSDNARAITSTSRAEMEKIKESGSKHVNSINTRLDASFVALNNAANTQRKAWESFVAASASSTAQLSSGLTVAIDSLKSQSQAWSSELKSRDTDSSAFGQNVGKDAGTFTQQISNYDLTAYSATGMTPAKKSWSYPTELTRSKPEAEIIAVYRNGGEAVPLVDPLAEARKIAEASLKALHEPKETKPIEPPAPVDSEEPEPVSDPAELEQGTANNLPAKPKAKPLAPSSTSTLQRQNSLARTSTAVNLPASRIPVAKPGLGGRENPRPAQPAPPSAAQAKISAPGLKKAMSTQVQFTSQVRKPQDVTNTLNKQ